MSTEMLFALDEIQKRKSSLETKQEEMNTLLAIAIGTNAGLTPAISVHVYKDIIINTENRLENILHQVGSSFRK